MKVLIIQDFVKPYYSGGASRYISNLIQHLHAAGAQTVCITTSPNARTEFTEKSNYGVTYRIPVHLLNIPTFSGTVSRFGRLPTLLAYLFNPWAFKRIKSILQDEQPDVIHTFDTLYLSLGAMRAAAASGIPWVHTCLYTHLLSPLGVQSSPTGQPKVAPLWRLLLPITRRIIGNPQVVTSPSRATELLHRKWSIFPKSKYTVIPLATTLTLSPAKARRPGVHFLCVSRLDPEKGVVNLIKAFRGISSAAATLTICGSGKEENKLKDMAAGDARIRININPPDVTQYFAEASVLVSPTTAFETFNLAPAEGLCAGLAVIASNVPANAEIVTDEVGQLYPAGDAHALQKAMELYVAQPQLLHDHQKAANEYGKKYDMRENVQAYIRVYERCKTSSI